MKYLEFDTPATKQALDLASEYGLENHGLIYLERVFWNLPAPALYEEIVFRNEGHLAHAGPVLVNTGKHTARAAADKYVVREQSTGLTTTVVSNTRQLTVSADDVAEGVVRRLLRRGPRPPLTSLPGGVGEAPGVTSDDT